MNGATEATLAELLAVAKATNVNIEALQKLFSGGGGGGGGMSGLAKAAGPAAIALGALGAATSLVSGALNIMGNILGKVVGGFTDTVKNLYNFAKSAAMGTARLSDFYDAFRDLPFFIGTVASLFADIIRYSESLLEVYRGMTQSGAAFSGDLFKMRQAAAQTGLSMDEFSRVVSSNSELFASMGGNVQMGIDKFVQAQQALMGKDSPYAKGILGLGVTAEESAKYLTTVITSQGAMGRLNSMSGTQLAKATNDYIVQLDTLSKLTGIRKDQLDAEIKRTEADQAFQLFLDSLSPEQAKKAQAAIAQAAATGGVAAREQMMASLRGIDVPLTEASQKLAVASNGASLQAYANVRELVLNQSVSLAEMNRRGIQLQAGVASQVKGFADRMGTGLQAVVGQMLPQEFLRFARNIEKSGIDEAMRLAGMQQGKQVEGNAASLAMANQNIRNFGNVIMDLVTRIIGPIAGELIKFGESITNTVVKYLGSDDFKNSVSGIINWFKNTWNYVTSITEDKSTWTKVGEKLAEGAKNIWEAVKPAFQYMWNEMRPSLITAFKDLTDTIAPYFKQMADYVLDAINAMIYNLPFGKMIFGAEDPEERKKRREQERVVSQIPGRAAGSLGMTGKLFENWGSGTPVTLHGNEAVVTPEQMGGIINNDLANELQTLNTQVAALLKYSRETAEYARRNVDATKGLSGNLFPTP